MSTISASTTSTTAFKITTDTTGALVFQTGASPTTAMTLGSDQSVTFAGTPTYSGGTANGVAYLNGSKVLTTGTVLVFDGTNLGLGATVNSWRNTWRVLTLGGTSGVGGSLYSNAGAANAQQIGIGANWYYDQSSGNNLRIGAGYAADYYQYNGTHVWSTAASSTAGSTITFTQAMTLDASGNLGVGTTSPGNFSGISFASPIVDVLGSIQVRDGGANGVAAIQFGGTTYRKATIYSGNGTTDPYLAFATASSGSSSSATERARFTSGGDFIVGGTSATAMSGVPGIQVGSSGTSFAGVGFQNANRAYVQFVGTGGYSNAFVVFDTTAATERSRITTGGYAKFTTYGTYLNGNYHEFNTSTSADWTLVVRHSSASPYGIDVAYTGGAPNNVGNHFYYAEDTGGLRFSVRSNGGVANYSANDVNLSDRREKTNFAPAGDYLAKICAIPVQTFNYIDQNLEEDDGLTLGVVAQDVQAVAPELVMESNWAEKGEEPKIRLSVYQTDLQYALMKAIQELNAKVVALENK